MSFDCTHNGAMHVFDLGKAQIWGGAKDDIVAVPDWKLTISALGRVALVAPFEADEGAQALLPPSIWEWTPPPVFGLKWPDGQVPGMSRAWWENLHEALHHIEGKVAIFCQGGHGRTGTALSILWGLSNKRGDPVKAIRKRYCVDAVETLRQIIYIEDILDRDVKAEPSHNFKAYQPARLGVAAPPSGGHYSGSGKGTLSGPKNFQDAAGQDWPLIHDD